MIDGADLQVGRKLANLAPMATEETNKVPSPARRLIVNADDFGLSVGVNCGIIAAHESGIVTSTSLMVRWPAAGEAVQLAATHPKLGIGLHLDLGEWAQSNYEWVAKYSVVDFDDPAAVEAEIFRQVERFFELMQRPPTHLDSHQHVHRDPRIAPVVSRAGEKLGVVVRHFDPRVAYCGNFYGQDEHGFPYHQAISAESLVRMIRELRSPVTEVACHAGYGRELDTMYRIEREMELAALCDPRVKQAVVEEQVELIHFGQLPMH